MNGTNRGQPVVSVIILTYNHASYIDECLASVYSQITDFDFEVLIADDCSTDGTKDKARIWQQRYPERTRLILRDKNLGGGGCPNLEATFPECRGEFVALLEGDDFWTFNRKLQAQADVMRRAADVAACTHMTEILSPDSGQMVPFRGLAPTGDLSLESLLTIGPPHTSSYMVRRSILDSRAASLRTLPMGDWPLMIHCASVGRVLSIPNSVWSVYRVQGQGSWATRGLAQRTRGEIRALNAFASVLPGQFQLTIRRELLRRQLWLAEGLVGSGERVAAIQAAIPAYLAWPRHTPVSFKALVKHVARLVLPRMLFARGNETKRK